MLTGNQSLSNTFNRVFCASLSNMTSSPEFAEVQQFGPGGV